MPDQILPPSGDPEKAEAYVEKLVRLISSDKLKVFKTDLSQFGLNNLEDHYRIDLNDFIIEISHSKKPESLKDQYIMLFTNVKKFQAESSPEKVILAYIHLDTNQYIRLKSASSEQIGRIKKAEEEKRLKAALDPIDQELEKLEAESNHKSLSDYSESSDNKPYSNGIPLDQTLN